MNVGTMEKFWIPFKYETLLVYYFRCGQIGHGVRECGFVSEEVKKSLRTSSPILLH